MNNNKNELNNAIMNKIHLQDWKNRALTSIALAVGVLCIGAGVFLMWGNSVVIFPAIQTLIKQSATGQNHGTNSASTSQTSTTDERLTLSDGTVVDRQILVTLMLGKSMYVMSRDVALLGVGTLLTLLLIIFNRRVALRQINISLTQISAQIKELQNRQSS